MYNTEAQDVSTKRRTIAQEYKACGLAGRY